MLTSLTAITLPTLIIGGWFGQNFVTLPWRGSAVAYWATFGITAALTLGLLWFLRRRRWL